LAQNGVADENILSLDAVRSKPCVEPIPRLPDERFLLDALNLRGSLRDCCELGRPWPHEPNKLVSLPTIIE
jgi:hypothetical protein